MSEKNVEAVKRMYAAFGRGDVAGILKECGEDVVFECAAGGPQAIPWHQPFRGKAALPKFFEAIAHNADVERFEPRAFAASGEHVAVQIGFGYRAKKSGKRVSEEQVHWWTFGADGRAKHLRHYLDVRDGDAAFR